MTKPDQMKGLPMQQSTTKIPSTSPFVAETTPMLSEAILRLDSVAELKPSRLRDMKSALRTVARLVGRPPERVPANINWLHTRLLKVAPKAHNITPKRLANIKSDAIKALELVGCSRARADWLRSPSLPWQTLIDQIPDQHDRWRLAQLARYCSALGIEPEAVSDAQVQGLLTTLIEESFQVNPRRKVADAIRAWNRMRNEIAGWPAATLSPLPPTKVPWTIPIEQFSLSFQEDVARWIDRLTKPDLLDDDGPAKPLRPATIKHRRFQLREAASALVHSGMPIEQVTSLAVLVDFDNVKRALRWMMARFDDKPTEAIKGVAVCLQAVARHHLKGDVAQLKAFSGLVKRLARDADGLREKNRLRLLQLDDPQNMAKLLHLPAALVKKAHQMRNPRRAALTLQAALAIEILLNAPMRIGNLSALHIDRHLRPIGRGRAREIHIHVPATEVKNEKALNYILPPRVNTLVEIYLATARPVLEGSPSEYLFPAQNGGPKTPNSLSDLIKVTIREHIGLDINAHLFRSIAGKIHSLVQPGDFVTLSHVLNNELRTAMKAYAQFEQQASIEHYQASLQQVRKGGAA